MAKSVLTSTTDSPEKVAEALATNDEAETADEGGTGSDSGEDEAEPDADSDADVDEEPPAAKAKTAKTSDETVEGLQRKIKRMTFEQHRTQDYASSVKTVNDSLLARMAELEAKISGGTKTETEPEIPKFSKPAPKLEDAVSIEKWQEDYQKYLEEKIQFDLDARDAVKDKKHAEKTAQESQEQFANRVQEEHNARIIKFREEHDDWDETAQAAIDAGVKLTPPMLAHIMQSDTGPALLYYLGKHPNVAKEVAALNAGPTLVRLGRIEAMLESEAGTATGDGDEGEDTDEGGQAARRPLAAATDRTKVPPKPPAKIVGGTGGKNTKDPAKMSLAEYRKWRAAGGK
jgi:hypothetical protein